MGRKRMVDLERLRKLAEEGYSQKEIARALGVSEAAIYHWKKRLGIEIVSKKGSGAKRSWDCDRCPLLPICKKERLWLTGLPCELTS